ncbi:transposase [Hymenobacter terrenus]|uniref:transposase n=1 Tax=Hymenobacter terrenus TaxID=1629124 RepID=UPI000A806962
MAPTYQTRESYYNDADYLDYVGEDLIRSQWTVAALFLGMRCHDLSDRKWPLIEPHTLGQPGTRGGMGHDNHLFVTAVSYLTRTCIPWRDLPARFRPWNIIARRFRLCAVAGVWEVVILAV